MSQARKPFHKKYSDSGKLIFTKSQTDNRFALCKAALCPTRKYSIRFKAIYAEQSEIEAFSRLEFDEIAFLRNLVKLHEIGWGGKFKKYEKEYSPEGAFYPFIRFRGAGYIPIDTGAIWIGARDCYPRIFVDNGIANWIEPYSRSGSVMTEPFDIYSEVSKNMKRLSNKAVFPMLDIVDFV